MSQALEQDQILDSKKNLEFDQIVPKVDINRKKQPNFKAKLKHEFIFSAIQMIDFQMIMSIT